ncbi:MAG: ATP-dependent endonuclease [Alphaproteobacteria bacterium]|nr:ATP-dependent endonuclease [Alphaproteobacteria bacterium]
MDLNKVITLLNKEFPYEPTDGQRRVMEELALFLILSWKKSNALFLLCGYAGTGKTTLVKSLVDVLPKIGKRTVLLAPTGRAAKVLTGYTKREANTIHRKIYLAHTTKEGQISLRLQTNYHKHTLFIVDEASMIHYGGANNGALFSSRNLLDDLFHYVYSGENCRMMFIGDTAQLPPVGLGYSPALDKEFLKQTYHLSLDTFELTEVVRQAKKSGILVNATLVREQLQEQKFELPILTTGAFKDIQRITGAELEEVLNHSFSGSEKDHNVVVCRSNKRANIFNREIRRRILYYEDEISTGDYLMIVKNNYFWLPDDSKAGFIANGDIVELMRIRTIEELYGFRFADVTIRFLDYPEEKELDVKIILNTLMSESAALSQADNNRLFQAVMEDYAELSSRRARLEQVKINPFFNALQVKFAYALTCHKTQGGQWNTVFIDQGYLNDAMINLEYGRWLYTALTRATRRLFLVNFEERFFKK